MASILDISLPSDEDDEEFINEEESEDIEDLNTNDDTCNISNSIPVLTVATQKRNYYKQSSSKDNLKKKIKKNSKIKYIDEIYKEMKKSSNSVNHTSLIKKDDMMLQFHKRYPKNNKKRNSSLSDLKHHLDIAVSCLSKDDKLDFNLKQFKEKCRHMPSDESKIAINSAISENNEITLEKKVFFAGKTHTISTQLDKNSIEYQRYLQKKNKLDTEKTSLSSLDAYLNKFDHASTISTLDKSTHDWKRYISDSGLENTLANEGGFLEKQSFLMQTNWKEHEIELNRKKFGKNS